MRLSRPSRCLRNVVGPRACANAYAAPPSARHGRLLVECMVAMLLLALSSLSLSTAVVATSTMGDDALQLAIGQRAQGNAAGLLLMAPCDSVSANTALSTTHWITPRQRLTTFPRPSGSLRHERIEVQWRPSPLAVGVAAPWSRRLEVSAAVRCR